MTTSSEKLLDKYDMILNQMSNGQKTSDNIFLMEPNLSPRVKQKTMLDNIFEETENIHENKTKTSEETLESIIKDVDERVQNFFTPHDYSSNKNTAYETAKDFLCKPFPKFNKSSKNKKYETSSSHSIFKYEICDNKKRESVYDELEEILSNDEKLRKSFRSKKDNPLMPDTPSLSLFNETDDPDRNVKKCSSSSNVTKNTEVLEEKCKQQIEDLVNSLVDTLQHQICRHIRKSKKPKDVTQTQRDRVSDYLATTFVNMTNESIRRQNRCIEVIKTVSNTSKKSRASSKSRNRYMRKRRSKTMKFQSKQSIKKCDNTASSKSVAIRQSQSSNKQRVSNKSDTKINRNNEFAIVPQRFASKSVMVIETNNSIESVNKQSTCKTIKSRSVLTVSKTNPDKVFSYTDPSFIRQKNLIRIVDEDLRKHICDNEISKILYEGNHAQMENHISTEEFKSKRSNTQRNTCVNYLTDIEIENKLVPENVLKSFSTQCCIKASQSFGKINDKEYKNWLKENDLLRYATLSVSSFNSTPRKDIIQSLSIGSMQQFYEKKDSQQKQNTSEDTVLLSISKTLIKAPSLDILTRYFLYEHVVFSETINFVYSFSAKRTKILNWTERIFQCLFLVVCYSIFVYVASVFADEHTKKKWF